jgi:hypothetical protein
MTDSGQSAIDARRKKEASRRRLLPEHETFARDQAFKQSIGASVREGIIWDEAWEAARSYYAARVRDREDARA